MNAFLKHAAKTLDKGSKIKNKKNSKNIRKEQNNQIIYDEGEDAENDNTEDEEKMASDMNSLEILQDENHHLKRLLERMETDVYTQKSNLNTGKQKEIDEIKEKLYEEESKNVKLEGTIEKLKLEISGQQSAHTVKVEELTSQLHFAAAQHDRELQEKFDEIESLENRLIQCKEELEIAMEPPQDFEVTDDVEYLQKHVKELSRIIEANKATLKRKDEQLEEWRNEAASSKKEIYSDKNDLVVESLNAVKIKCEEAENMVQKLRFEEAELRSTLKSSELQIRRLENRVASFEKENEDLTHQLEVLKGDASSLVDTQTEVLLQEKTKTIWDLQDRLLESSTTIRNLQQELEGTPRVRVPSSSKVDSPTGDSNLPSNRDSSDTTSTQKLLREGRQRVSELQKELNRLKLENESMKSSKTSSIVMGMHRNIMVPISLESGSKEVDLLRVELQLKDNALHKLSLKNQQLIEEIEAGGYVEKIDHANIWRDEINELHLKLIHSKEIIHKLEEEKGEVENKFKKLEIEFHELNGMLDEVRGKYDGLQKQMEEKIKTHQAEINTLTSMIGRAISDADELQLQLHNEKTRSIATAEQWNDSLAALEERTMKSQGFPTDLFARGPRMMSREDDESSNAEISKTSAHSKTSPIKVTVTNAADKPTTHTVTTREANEKLNDSVKSSNGSRSRKFSSTLSASVLPPRQQDVLRTSSHSPMQSKSTSVRRGNIGAVQLPTFDTAMGTPFIPSPRSYTPQVTRPYPPILESRVLPTPPVNSDAASSTVLGRGHPMIVSSTIERNRLKSAMEASTVAPPSFNGTSEEVRGVQVLDNSMKLKGMKMKQSGGTSRRASKTSNTQQLSNEEAPNNQPLKVLSVLDFS